MRRDHLGREALALLGELTKFARWLEHRSADAEDLVQAAFAKALERASDLGDPAKLKPWLFRLTYRLHIDRRRQDASRARLMVLEGGLDELEPRAMGNLEIDILQRINAQEIDRALRQLPEDQRIALVLVDAWEYTYDEVADIVGIPVNTVRSRVTRARARLEIVLARGNHGKPVKEGSACRATTTFLPKSCLHGLMAH